MLPTALCTAAILYITIAPHPAGEELVPVFPGYDKVIHGIMFFGLTLCVCVDALLHPDAAPTRRRLLCILLVCAAFGAVDECMQTLLTADREGSVADWLADFAGCTLALFLYRAAYHRQP